MQKSSSNQKQGGRRRIKTVHRAKHATDEWTHKQCQDKSQSASVQHTPRAAITETLWWLRVVELLVYLWGQLQLITGDGQGCWLAGWLAPMSYSLAATPSSTQPVSETFLKMPSSSFVPWITEKVVVFPSTSSFWKLIGCTNLFLMDDHEHNMMIDTRNRAKGLTFSSIYFGIHSESHEQTNTGVEHSSIRTCN